jgi:hypothetical protein
MNYECLRNCVWCGPQQAVSNALTARRYGQNVQVGNIPYLFIQLTCKGHLPDAAVYVDSLEIIYLTGV